MLETVIDQQMAAHRTTTSRLPINTQQQGLSAAKSHPGLRLYSPQRRTACLQIYWQTSAAEGTCLTGTRGLMPSGAQLGDT